MLVEFLIIGLFFLSILVFAFLLVFGIRIVDFQWAYIKDYVPLVVVLFLVTDYLLGVVAYELVNIIAKPFRWLTVKLNILRFDEGDDRTARYAKILQYGSELLLKRYEFNITLLRIYKNLTFYAPILGTLVIVWSAFGGMTFVSLSAAVVTIAMTVILCISFFNRRRIQDGFFDACSKIVKR
jgi:hypothetical protein